MGVAVYKVNQGTEIIALTGGGASGDERFQLVLVQDGLLLIPDFHVVDKERFVALVQREKIVHHAVLSGIRPQRGTAG